ncbi:MAG: hypothetical protein ACYCSI_09395 [Solirubrobacteraceae bacterium]
MEQPNKIDVDSVVRKHFQQYLGTTDGFLLEREVIADAGVDSILLVMILTDLFVDLSLDVGDAKVKLADIKTLADVATLAKSMLDERLVLN